VFIPSIHLIRERGQHSVLPSIHLIRERGQRCVYTVHSFDKGKGKGYTAISASEGS